MAEKAHLYGGLWPLVPIHAALVRSEIASRACSGTAARIWAVSRFAIGKSPS